MRPAATKIQSAWLLLIVAAALPSPVTAAEYYAGKTIELIVGAPPGGGYDIYARTVGRYLGRHIPGEPSVVVKNMPGAGSAKAAQYIATIAPKDGTSIGGIMPGAIMGPLLDDHSAAMFDPNKVRYVGNERVDLPADAPFEWPAVEEVLDAYLWLGPKGELRWKKPDPSVYDDGEYLTELRRRGRLMGYPRAHFKLVTGHDL